ncbi:hypothetical protein P154DRAFT_622035 [Amniculicola lignicola CBS 123094]|uniref:Uncharacterized protein n=1 Tax=Amniculicola lignicola CBS 123094 TaxID=1392246 RepID=A0A6A5WAX4_9PLEO|nr:hypothetical protein P154DRAFT_622035 [Amniculicola lignicola CBS 123094]
MPQYLFLNTSKNSLPSIDVDPDETPAPKTRRGIWRFLRHNLTILLALSCGLACITAVLLFSSHLSNQILRCPDWSTQCKIPFFIEVVRNNIGTIQGISTAVYAIGLGALAYAAHAFSESALWPLLNRQSLSLKQVDTYLEASRGSIPSSPSALWAARSFDSILVIMCTVFITLIPLGGAPLMGYVYDQKNMTHDFESLYQPGGGIEPLFAQSSPPESLRDQAGSLYSSWAYNISHEPMPAFRDWFVDRSKLEMRGSMSVKAVKIKQEVVCRGWRAGALRKEKGLLWFKTNMRGHRKNGTVDHSEEIGVRDKPRLAVWVHDYRFPTPTKTSATVIFASLNGDIESGEIMPLPGNAAMKNISSVACDIDVEFIEDTLTVGFGSHGAPVEINAIKSLRNPVKGGNATLNELALWFAVAPVANGVSVDGAQPMYVYDQPGQLPLRYTSTTEGESKGWSVNDLANLIRVSTGASALAESSRRDDGRKVIMTSRTHTMRLDPSRPILLLILPILILLNALALIIWNIRMHDRLEIPIMRKATLSELLKSAQTEDIRVPASAAKFNDGWPSGLDALKSKVEDEWMEDGQEARCTV